MKRNQHSRLGRLLSLETSLVIMKLIEVMFVKLINGLSLSGIKVVI